MRYQVTHSKENPAYLQLYRQVREDIIQGIYPYHSKIPSKRMIAEEVGVSRVTVEHALDLLCEEGYLESRERSGYFVAFRNDDGFAVPAKKEEGTTFSAVHIAEDAPEFPFSVLAKTMRSVLSDRGETILDRSPSTGCIELREAIRQYLARSRGIFADLEQVVIGAGSEYLYSLIIGLLGREQIFGIESPSYKKIEQVYRAAGIPCEKLPLSKDGIESSALWSSGANILHISPYRSFPSGVTATASKRHEYLRWAGQGQRYIIEDDFESEFSISRKPEETLFSLTEADNVIYMNTFSRTVSSSLRVGYMVLPKQLVGRFTEKMGFYSCTVPTFLQYVLADLITNGDFERQINRVRRKKRKEIAETKGIGL